MTIVGVIPSRWGSTRFPGKSLHPLLGKPLIQWVIERARRARRLDEVLVATDDERIRAAAIAVGAQVAMTRPEHPSGTDRIAEAVAGRDVDVVVNIQGDEPLIDPELIDRVAELLIEDSACPMATAAVPLDQPEALWNPAVVKVACDAAGRALYFSRAPIPFHRDAPRQPVPQVHLRHLGLYAFRGSFLRRFVSEPPCALETIEKLEQLRALYLGACIRVVIGADSGVAVDTPEDVPAAENALRAAMSAPVVPPNPMNEVA